MIRSLLFLLLGLGTTSGSSVSAQDEGESEIEVGAPRDHVVDTRPEWLRPAPVPAYERAPERGKNWTEKVELSVQSGVRWLKSVQNRDGSWDPMQSQWEYGTGKKVGKHYQHEMATTLFALYTLARCGLDPRKDPSLKKGIAYVLAETEFTWDELGAQANRVVVLDASRLQQPTRREPREMSTYEVAVSVLLVDAAYGSGQSMRDPKTTKTRMSKSVLKPPRRSKIKKDIWKWMHRRVRFLTTGYRSKNRHIPGLQVRRGPNTGGWRYGPVNPNSGQGNADLSATHIALAALQAAARSGYPVEKLAPTTFQDAARFVLSCQRPSGGFAYHARGGVESGSMTACGVMSLLICREQAVRIGKAVDPRVDVAIQKGLGWLDQTHVAIQSPEGDNHHYYYLFALSGLREFREGVDPKRRDWPRNGARAILEDQSVDGWWIDATEVFQPRKILSTTLALNILNATR